MKLLYTCSVHIKDEFRRHCYCFTGKTMTAMSKKKLNPQLSILYEQETWILNRGLGRDMKEEVIIILGTN